MLRSALLPIVATVSLMSATPVLAADNALTGGGTAVAALGSGLERPAREATPPRVLSDSDERLYRAAADAADHGDWTAANRALARVGDTLLVPHFEAERLLAPGVKPSADAFRAWMVRHPDLPEAEAVYERARETLGARFKGIAAPATPFQSATFVNHDEDAGWERFAVDDSDRGLAHADERRLAQFKEHFRAKLRAGDFDVVATLRGPEAHRLLSPADLDEMRGVVALALFDAGRDSEALPWALSAASGSGDVMPETHWLSGLILWRLHRPAEAIEHFEAVANSQQLSGWMTAAGAYWAARANLAAHRPELVNHWLQQAAGYPRTLYGMLARRALGLDLEYSWISRPFTDADADLLVHNGGGRRALALIQIGDTAGAQEELRHLVPTATVALSRSMLALAYATGMPDLAINLSDVVSAQDGRFHDTTDYPVPRWRPTNGWEVDRALVFAIVRQESGFNPRARSRAGAVGLMQLMPDTARALGSSKARITDPDANLMVGQRYLLRLLSNQAINGNLLLLAASYNAGLGAVGRWQQTLDTGSDALLFLESIPAHETRVFVERVLTGFWAYRDRLGEHSSSIDALAAGSWPIYDVPASGIQAATRNDED